MIEGSKAEIEIEEGGEFREEGRENGRQEGREEEKHGGRQKGIYLYTVGLGITESHERRRDLRYGTIYTDMTRVRWLLS